MPKIDVAAVPEHKGVGYPPPYAAMSADRIRQRLGEGQGRRFAPPLRGRPEGVP